MSSREVSPAPPVRPVVVIGAGLVGLSTAWLLQRRGHPVLLIDGRPGAPGSPAGDGWREAGSEAALGVLMAGVFHRSSGRAWRLRQQSQALWQAWIEELAGRGRPIPWRPGLLLLAASEADREHQQALLSDPRRPPAGLRWLEREALQALWPPPPQAALGGLLSPADGQLDPIAALAVLRADAEDAGLEIRRDRAEAIERRPAGWRLRLASGEAIEASWVVIAAGLGSTALIPADRPRVPQPLEPVLGQALELELDPRTLPAPPAAGHRAS